MLITVKRAPMVRSSCKSGVLQHPINMSHIIILRKLQKIKMRTRSTNQSEKIPKKKKKKKPKATASRYTRPMPAVGLNPRRP
jgi:hypothetical protein